MLWYDREGYYTYEQVAEAFEYVKMEDPTDDKYHQHFFYDHLKSILEEMEQYKMEIVLARDVLKYDEFTNAMVDLYRIIPTPFKSKTHDYLELQISAPNYREAEFCGNCKYFSDQTDYDDMLNGICDIHTEINVEYNPPLKSPLSLGCYGVCDNFKFKGD